MGEVYRARDTRLGRDVAIKVLPEHLSKFPEIRQRFEREARAVSSLNHPHICTLHDVGHQDGVDFLVMECLEGEPLAARLKRGPLALDEALRYAIQIADALDKAHRQGVVHRDLKPGNIMITKAGAKLLDFGLSRTLEGGAATAPSASGSEGSALPTHQGLLTASPTMESPLTAQGAVLGTYQYMSPEQLDGRPADARSDIFAFGLVLYEMVSGQRAFTGNTQASLVASILKDQPRPLGELAPVSPPALERLVRACLEKDPDERRQSVHDVLMDLKWIAGGGAATTAGLASEERGQGLGASRSRLRERLWMGAALLLLAAAVVLGLLRPGREREGPDPVFLQLTNPSPDPDTIIDSGAISPDGKAMVLVLRDTSEGTRSLWLRPISSATATPLPGTEDGHAPFWSPDSRFVGFFAERKLKKIAVAGGPPVVIADAPAPTGGAWGPDGTIIFSPDEGPIFRVDASGGAVEKVTELDTAEEAHRWPAFLPGGRRFVFQGDATRREDHHLKIGDLDAGVVATLVSAITNPAFAPPDRLLFVRAGSLMVQRLDLDKLTLEGEPVEIAENLLEAEWSHFFTFSASTTGVLTYKSADLDARLAWLDREGKELEVIEQEGRFGDVRLSRTGTRLLFERLDPDGRIGDLWLKDLERNVTSRLTFHPGQVGAPVWSADEATFAYFWSQEGSHVKVFTRLLDRPEEEKQLGEVGASAWPQSWSPDGKHIVVLRLSPDTREDLWLMSADPSEEPRPLIATPFTEQGAAFSPDGRWLAYESDETGRMEAYLRRYPLTSWKLQVSTRGGAFPRWRGDGREIFYLDPTGTLNAVALQPGEGSLSASNPEVLFDLGLPSFGVTANGGYSPAPDGRRFLVVQREVDPRRAPITIVLNWTRLLDDRSKIP